MSEAKQLMSLSDLDAMLKASTQGPVLLFKHSTTCPISAGAHRQWRAFLATPEAAKADHAWVRVIEERPVSRSVAERVGVEHQSPQALLIKDGKVLWHASHHAITVDALKAAVSRS